MTGEALKAMSAKVLDEVRARARSEMKEKCAKAAEAACGCDSIECLVAAAIRALEP